MTIVIYFVEQTIDGEKTMIDNDRLGYGKYFMDDFEFESGHVLHDVPVEYTTRGTPKYDDEGNITNAVIFCHKSDGNCLSIGNLDQLIGPNSITDDFNFFYISITSLGYPESCSPSTSELKFDFPPYSINDCVNFKKKFLSDAFDISNVLGIIGIGIGGYEAYTWICEHPSEIEFLIIANSSFKTNNYRYITSRTIDTIIESSDSYYNDIYDESLSKIMISINSLLYSHSFSKRTFENFTREEIDIFLENFIDEGLSVDLYDLKYRNNSILNYNVEEKLSKINAKTLILGASEDIYYSPEFDVYPLKEKIENLKIIIFDAQKFVYNDDYSIFSELFRDFLLEFKK